MNDADCSSSLPSAPSLSAPLTSAPSTSAQSASPSVSASAVDDINEPSTSDVIHVQSADKATSYEDPSHLDHGYARINDVSNYRNKQVQTSGISITNRGVQWSVGFRGVLCFKGDENRY